MELNTSTLAAPRRQTRMTVTFSVAGIAVSASGVPALCELLRYLGRSGIALLIVTAPDIGDERRLARLLAQTTALPVHELEHGTRLSADHVYVVPYGSELEIEEGIVELERAVEGVKASGAVDRIFDVIASAFGSHAIGVVLSAHGCDGVLGLRSIREAGGCTFAHEAMAAQHAFSDAVSAGGCIDLMAAPRAIAEELERLGPSPAPEDGAALADQPDAVLRGFIATLRRASGIDFEQYKPATLRRRVWRRVLFHGMTGFAEYLDLVTADAAEARALSEEILIHVTSFFRDRAVFEALTATCFPRLLERYRTGHALRIWVPGCSTGEEVYSLAISLLEFLGSERAPHVPIKVFGTDVSETALQYARAGMYGAGIESDVSAERLHRFFYEEGGTYFVRQEVRDICVFARHDATTDPPFPRVDLLSCRNLMIYFGADQKVRLLSAFQRALRSGGFLVLGPSESLRTSKAFKVVDPKLKIYRRTAQPPLLEASTKAYVRAVKHAGPFEELPRGVSAAGADHDVTRWDCDTPESSPEAAPESSLQGRRPWQELKALGERLQGMIEQLEARNEALRAFNEQLAANNRELILRNEELHSAEGELKSINEELRALNHELTYRHAEATRLSEDLSEIVANGDIPVLLLGDDTSIRRFTPAAGRTFSLQEHDLGRSLGAFPTILASAGVELANSALRQTRAIERRLQDENGRWYQVTARPYVARDARVRGTAITARELDAFERGASRSAGV